ncbi:MAG: DUF4157 domain-containing protein [Anaerolineae bacterium]
MSRVTKLSQQLNAPGSDRQPTARRGRSHPLLSLQRVVGNQAVLHLRQEGLLQAKLTVNAPGDVFEQEADRVAAHVVSRLVHSEKDLSGGSDAELVQRQEWPEEEELQMLQAGPISQVQRQVEPEEEEEEEELSQPRRSELTYQLQRQEIPEEEELLQASSAEGAFESSEAVEADLARAQGGGQVLDPALRGSLESGFGNDFSGVRIHADARADALARQLNADAFTTGPDIYFRAGRYQPGTAEGQFLLAHELTHTVQQGAAPELDEGK